MTWASGAPFVPQSVEQWLDQLQRRMNDRDMQARGMGRTLWTDAALGVGVSVDGSATPGWRKLNDGRVELRGHVLKGTAWADGDVVLRLPLECAPPHNSTIVSSVTMLAPCTTVGGPGVWRCDVQRGPWLGPATLVEVIARLPQQTGFTGWLGFDHVTFDPYLYMDALPPVPYGEVPLVPYPGTAAVQMSDGTVVTWTPGVEFYPPSIPNEIPPPAVSDDAGAG